LAAAIISSGFLEIAMVKFDGTLTRIFCDEIERPERHEPVTLENGGDELRPAVDALGTLSFPGLAEHDKNLVGRTHFEAAERGRYDNDEE
jgi:hypothetical protein